MRHFSQSISSKINFPFAVIFLFVLGGLILSATTSRYTLHQMEAFQEQTEHLVEISHFTSTTYSLILSIHNSLLHGDPAFVARFNRTLDELTWETTAYLEDHKTIYQDYHREVPMIKELNACLVRVRALSGDLFKAFETTGSIDPQLMNSLQSEAFAIEANADLIEDLHKQRTAFLVETSQARIRFLFGLYVAFFLLGFMLLLIVNMIILRYVAWPVKKLAVATADLARGSLHRRVESRSEDEVGALAQSFNKMAERLEEHDREQRDFSLELERMVKERTRDLEQTTEHLRSTQDSLVRTEKQAMLGRMAAAVTHEIKTPLNSLAINFQILQRQLQELKEPNISSISESLSTIDLEVSRINQVLEDFVAYARFPEPKIRTMDLNSVVQKISKFMAPEATATGVTFQLDLHPDIPPVEADEDKVRQLLINLCANAIQAMPDGGSITLATEQVEDDDGLGRGVRIRVTDQGIGIHTEAIDSIFEPFTTTKTGGMGLGLPIVARIVDQHNGQIFCRSEEGRGTTFEVFLPAAHNVMDRNLLEMS